MNNASALAVKASAASNPGIIQVSTFYVGGRLYGIDVMQVQEVVKPLAMTQIPLADDYVCGLINLRGQVATAIGLHQLFGIKRQQQTPLMNVICRSNGNLLALLADEIGDVIEISPAQFAPVPATVDAQMRRFMTGIYKVNGPLLSIIDSEKIDQFLSNKA